VNEYSGVIIQIKDFALFFLVVQFISGTKLFWLTTAPIKPKCVTPFNSQGAVYYAVDQTSNVVFTVVLTFKSVDETLECYHGNEST